MSSVVSRLRTILNEPVGSCNGDKRHKKIDEELVRVLERNLRLPELSLKSGYISSKELFSARQKRLLVTFSASSAFQGVGAEQAIVAARRVISPFTWLNIWRQGGMSNGGRDRKWFTTDIEIEAIRFKRDRPDLWKV